MNNLAIKLVVATGALCISLFVLLVVLYGGTETKLLFGTHHIQTKLITQWDKPHMCQLTLGDDSDNFPTIVLETNRKGLHTVYGRINERRAKNFDIRIDHVVEIANYGEPYAVYDDTLLEKLQAAELVEVYAAVYMPKRFEQTRALDVPYINEALEKYNDCIGQL